MSQHVGWFDCPSVHTWIPLKRLVFFLLFLLQTHESIHCLVGRLVGRLVGQVVGLSVHPFNSFLNIDVYVFLTSMVI